MPLPRQYHHVRSSRMASQCHFVNPPHPAHLERVCRHTEPKVMHSNFALSDDNRNELFGRPRVRVYAASDQQVA